MEHFAWTVALTRMISAVFRRGGDLHCRGGTEGGLRSAGRVDVGQYVPLLLAAIGGVIERHMVDIGFIADPKGTTRPRDAVRQRIFEENGSASRGPMSEVWQRFPCSSGGV